MKRLKNKTVLEINLNHVESNFTFIKILISKNTKMLAMIKAAGMV